MLNLLIVLINVFTLSTTYNCYSKQQEQSFLRIVGGQHTNEHEYPWASALLRNSVLYCGATVITNSYLLTAAHCVYNFDPKDILVHIGSHRITFNAENLRQVFKVIYHTKFDVISFDNDIGLLKIKTALVFTYGVQPVNLPNHTDAFDYSGELGIVSGWGNIGENNTSSHVLKSVIIPIWSQSKCERSGYGPKRLTVNMFCAGYEEGLYDACQGDSGGAMLRSTHSEEIEIIGVISWGRGCARPTFPGVYTIVRNYIKWIEKSVKAECICFSKT